MITTILYDVDQTILNSPRYNFSNTFTKEMGISADAMLPFFKGVFRECTTGKADLKEVIAPFLKDWNWKGTVDELLAFWFSAENNIETRLTSHVGELRNKGIRCFLATDNEAHRTKYLWETLNLRLMFDGIFASSAIGYTKEENGFWLYVLGKLPAGNTQDILFWDDDPKNVELARTCGVNAEVYTDFDTYKNKTEALTSSQIN